MSQTSSNMHQMMDRLMYFLGEKKLFKVSETQELIDLHENHLKTFIEEAIETVDGNNVLKVTRENHNILKEIF